MIRTWSHYHLTTILLPALVLNYSLLSTGFQNNPSSFLENAALTNDQLKTVHAQTALIDRRLKLLRYRHQLRPLNDVENGKRLQELPNGIYGFSRCSERVESTPGSPSALEAHKRFDGIAYYVGYASEEDIRKYLARKNKFHIRLFPQSDKSASTFFEIPIYFVAKCELRSYREQDYFDLYVLKIPKLH